MMNNTLIHEMSHRKITLKIIYEMSIRIYFIIHEINNRKISFNSFQQISLMDYSMWMTLVKL